MKNVAKENNIKKRVAQVKKVLRVKSENYLQISVMNYFSFLNN